MKRRWPRLITALLAWSVTISVGSFGFAGEQQPPPQSAIAEARRLRDAGQFVAAADLLRRELVARPADGEASRMLAETLYWLHDRAGSRTVYDAHLARHPQDTTARLSYARMLAEIGDFARARETVEPLHDNPAVRVDAQVLLGTIAYWSGDFTTAIRRFEQALALAPDHQVAARSLREIRSATGPWIRVRLQTHDDDQPLDSRRFGMEAGWFVTPLSSIKVRFDPRQHSVTSGSTTDTLTADALWSTYLPAHRMDLALRGGIHRRQNQDSPEWIGGVAVGVRLPTHLSLRAAIDRDPYLHTLASLDQPVFVRTTAATARLQSPSGWLGEAGIQQQRFADGNTVGSVFAWQLVPLVFQPRFMLQAGYAFSREHADESRFGLATPAPFPPGNAPFSTAGKYAPYYTPSHLVKHAVTAAASVSSTGGTTLRVSGSYGFRATEDAPVLYLDGVGVQRTFYSRSFHPQSAQGSLDVPVGRSLTLSFSGETGRTAFYRWTSAALEVTYRRRPATAAAAAR
jgi:tetratricopeptide (TPR) repeat protein